VTNPVLPNIGELKMLVDRVLALHCSDTTSPRHGSFDRDFWAYRTVRGFQSGPYQHVMSGFAYLGEQQTADARVFFRELAESALKQWVWQRNPNGSTNEWYRNEQSFCATAMGLHAATETLLTLEKFDQSSSLNDVDEQLVNSERWLAQRSNPQVANQEVASLVGRWNLGALLQDRKIQKRAETALARVIDGVDATGYLSEYGGFDIGYSLLSLDLLVSSHRAGFTDVLLLAARICNQLSSVVSRGGDLPFALGSRGTHHPFFGGARYFSTFIPEAAKLLSRLRNDWMTHQIRQTMSYDDRYLATFGFAAATRLFIPVVGQSVEPYCAPVVQVPSQPPLLERFDLANGTLFCNCKLGSSLQFLGDDHTRVTHLGYSFASGGRWWCSLSKQSEANGSTRHQFVKQSSAVPLQRFDLAFAFLQTLCRFPWVASRVSRWARLKIGRSSKTRPTYFSRSIKVHDDDVEICDEIISKYQSDLSKVQSLAAFPFHSPSLVSSVEMISINQFPAEHFVCNDSASMTLKWKLSLGVRQVTHRVRSQ
jgi:hypothetical protein